MSTKSRKSSRSKKVIRRFDPSGSANVCDTWQEQVHQMAVNAAQNSKVPLAPDAVRYRGPREGRERSREDEGGSREVEIVSVERCLRTGGVCDR